MEVNTGVTSAMDMSLDEIIKLNKKSTRMAAWKARPVGKKRSRTLRRSGVLRSALSRPMKSQQTMAAQAIFRRARRTAAIAAKVAADALALATPSNAAGIYKRGVGGGAVTVTNRAINRKLVVRRQLVKETGRLFGEQKLQQRQGLGFLDLRGLLNDRNRYQDQLPVQQVQPMMQSRSANVRARNRKENKSSRRSLAQHHQRVVTNAAASGSWRTVSTLIRPILPRRGGAPNRALLNSIASPATTPYQQYIQQARALIRAQQELRNSSRGKIARNRSKRNGGRSSNVYVDVPMRNNGGVGFSGNRFRGRVARRRGRFRR